MSSLLTTGNIALVIFVAVLVAIAVEAYIAWEAKRPWRVEDDGDYFPFWREDK